MTIREKSVSLAAALILPFKIARRLVTPSQKNEADAIPDKKHADDEVTHAQGDGPAAAPMEPLAKTQEAQPHTNEGRREAQDTDNNPRRGAQTRMELLAAVSPIVAAVATVVYTVIAWYQWGAISEQAGLMNKQLTEMTKQNLYASEALEVGHRAYAGVKGIKMGGPIKVGEANVVTITYKILGNTPAYDFRMSTLHLIEEDTTAQQKILYAEEQLNRNLGEIKTESFIEPGTEGSQTITLSPPDERKMSLISENKAHIYVYVVIIYTDVFGKLQRNPFCAISTAGTYDFHPCPKDYITRQQQQQK